MIVVAFVLLSLFAQQLEPATQLSPAPGPSASTTQARTRMSVSDLPAASEYAGWLYDVAGNFLGDVDKGGINFTNVIWSLPDFLSTSRSPENTVDWGPAAQLNDTLTRQLLGLVLLAMGLVVANHALSILRGEIPNPLVALLLLTGVALAAFAAVNNRLIQHLPVELADLILHTIAGAPVKDVVQPGFHLSTMADPFWSALLLGALIIVTLGLTVILFIEGAWVVALGTLLGLALLGMPVPVFGGGCQYLIRRWLGSLFSPIICFTALRLATPSLQRLSEMGMADLHLQLVTLALLAVAWQAPGLMVAAVSVSFPSISSLYFAGRLFGAGRLSERMIGNGSGRGDDEGGSRTRRAPPRRISTDGFGMGSGRAARNKWAPAS